MDVSPQRLGHVQTAQQCGEQTTWEIVVNWWLERLHGLAVPVQPIRNRGRSTVLHQRCRRRRFGQRQQQGQDRRLRHAPTFRLVSGTNSPLRSRPPPLSQGRRLFFTPTQALTGLSPRLVLRRLRSHSIRVDWWSRVCGLPPRKFTRSSSARPAVRRMATSPSSARSSAVRRTPPSAASAESNAASASPVRRE